MNSFRRLSIKYVRAAIFPVLLFTVFQTAAFASVERVKANAPNVVRNKMSKQTVLWQKTSETNIAAAGRRLIVPEKYQVFSVNQKLLAETLGGATLEFAGASLENQVVLEVPTPEGGIAHFRIEESPMLAPSVAAQFPTWKTFQGQGVEDPTATARFDTNDNGFHGFVMGLSGTYLINPFAEGDRKNYIVYYKGDLTPGGERFSCNFKGKTALDFGEVDSFELLPQAVAYANGTQLRNFRIAVSASKQYTNFFGGNQTTAFAAVQTTVNRLITIYRRELATTFTLVSDTRTVFTNADDGGFTNNSNTDLDRNQVVLDTKYGNANYDIGHVLSVTPNPDGLAASPSLCDNTAKAQGFTGAATPSGDGFDVDYVAHEIGHQFGMSHTFNNSADGSCSTRSTASAFEPGSGVTIMAYGGICSPRNLAANSIEFFHARSFEQTLGYLPTVPATCGTLTTTGNAPPNSVDAGANRTIPKLTPFALTATAQDADAGLTYLWEEYDLGAATASTGARDTDEDGTPRPIFRSYNPTLGTSRTFPSLTYILNNSNTPPLTYTGTLPNAPTSGSTAGYACAPGETCVTGERLPSIARTMNFRVTVRDNNPNGGGVADATTQIAIDGTSGPFRVTTQNSAAATATWQAGTRQTVTWDVANTTNAAVNAQNVNILLSTDGGNTFPATLAANTPNDGSEQITVPNAPTGKARIKIVPIGNIFFDISDADFAISAPTAAVVAISGRVMTAGGRGISGATVTITDQNGQKRSVRATSFGYYKFANLNAGETYITYASAKRYNFAAQVVNLTEDLTGINFSAR